MTMTTEHPQRMSVARQQMAQRVERDAVRYVDGQLRPFTVDGVAVGGWDGRTLREMRSDGLIEIESRSGPEGSVVKLTKAGKASLAATPVHPDADTST